jgi:chemotaxis protein histidine kinase CheA
MADDGQITIGADTSGVRLALGLLEEELDGLDRSAKKNADSLDKYGERLKGAVGKKSGLMGNLKGISSILSGVQSRTSGMASAVKMLGKEGASVGQRVQGGINLASQAVQAFAGPGGMIVGAITLIAGLAIGISELFKETQEEAEKTEEEIESLAKAAEAANKTIMQLEAEEKYKEARQAIIEAEDALNKQKGTQNDVNAAIQKYREARDQAARADRLAARSFLNQQRITEERRSKFVKRSTKQRQKQEKEEKETAKKRENREKKLRSLIAKRIAEDEKAAGLRLLTLSGERALRVVVKNRQKELAEEREANFHATEELRRKENEELAIIQKAKDEEASIREKARKEEEEKEKAFHAEMLADVERIEDEEREIRLEAAKKREEEMQNLIKQSRDFTEIARTGFSTVTGELFNMAKAGEFSAQKLLNATLSAIGQQMVAQGTQLAFEGAAKALAGDPRGAGIAAIGVAEIAAGVGLGAAAGAGEAAQAAASAAPGAATAAPVDTRQTRAAAGPVGESGGPVVITFEGDVYDKRGVANVLNQGLGMARHRRLRGA